MKKQVTLTRSAHLKVEELDVLNDLDPDILRVLLLDMEATVVTMEAALVKHQYRPGGDDELRFLKVKAQGAREFINSYRRRLEILKSR